MEIVGPVVRCMPYLTPALGLFRSAKHNVKNTWFLKNTILPKTGKKT